MNIQAIHIGQPKTIHDQQGEWSSSIFRIPVAGPIELTAGGLAGDAVTDTKHHGSADQAVCCHPSSHYNFWNEHYGLSGPNALGPGSVGENWTLAGVTEADICIGDVIRAGERGARVEVTAPRYPCWKQERGVGLPDFLRQSVQTMRTGFYLRVLTPGLVEAGDSLVIEARPQPRLTVEALNSSVFREPDPEIVQLALESTAIMPLWKELVERNLGKQDKV